jgi:hypothetical protein
MSVLRLRSIELLAFKPEPYEADPEVPFWRSTVDVEALYAEHRQSGAVDLLTDLAMIDPDDTADLGQIVLMTGRFLPLLSNDTTYFCTFSPGMGEEQAVVLPINEHGLLVDLLAISTDDASLWGCVTGHGGMAGSFTADQPVRVYKQPWQWLLFGCDGVVVLANAAFSPKPFNIEPDGSVRPIYPLPPKLAGASLIYAESLDHADELLYRLFERPIIEDSHPSLSGQLLEMADRNVSKGLKRIGIDTERYDIDAEILIRSVDETLRTMKREGFFNE